MAETLNVYQRLSACKKLVAKQTFTKVKGEGLKFAYLPIEQIKPVVEDAMNEVGLVLLFGEINTYEVRPAYEKVSQYGDRSWWMHLGGRQTFTWVNIDSPDDRFVQTFEGEARDNSDKAFGKLYTAILKNFYKLTFNISTDRKDDIDNTEDEVRAEKEAARKQMQEARAKDPFFAKKSATVTEPPKAKTEADITGDAPVAPTTEVTTDRPLAEMVEQIYKWARNPVLAKVIRDFCAVTGNDDAESWTAAQIRECYAKCVDVGKTGGVL